MTREEVGGAVSCSAKGSILAQHGEVHSNELHSYSRRRQSPDSATPKSVPSKTGVHHGRSAARILVQCAISQACSGRDGPGSAEEVQRSSAWRVRRSRGIHFRIPSTRWPTNKGQARHTTGPPFRPPPLSFCGPSKSHGHRPSRTSVYHARIGEQMGPALAWCRSAQHRGGGGPDQVPRSAPHDGPFHLLCSMCCDPVSE